MPEGEFEFERATKTTYKFLPVAGSPPISSTVYFSKWLFQTQPKKIKVTVEVIE